jgi:hypothetical protein
MQCYGSGSVSGVLDPDSQGTLDPYPDSQSGSSKRTKLAQKNKKNPLKYLIFLNCWIFFFEGISCSLDVLYGGLGVSTNCNF